MNLVARLAKVPHSADVAVVACASKLMNEAETAHQAKRKPEQGKVMV